MAGLLSSARVANEGFAEVTLSLARQVQDLQGLCLLLGRAGPFERAELARIGARVADAAAQLNDLEAELDAELSVANEAQALVKSLRAALVAGKKVTAFVKNNSAQEETEQTQEEDDDTSKKDAEGDVIDNKAAADLLPSTVIITPTLAQLQSVPQYMRGRLTYDKLEQACEAVTRALSFKYDTLATQRGKQGPGIFDMILAWRDQDCDQAGPNARFVTVEDIISHGRESDRGAPVLEVGTLKNALQVLRYLGVLRHVGNGGIARYVC
jgi:hypothetical protein